MFSHIWSEAVLLSNTKKEGGQLVHDSEAAVQREFSGDTELVISGSNPILTCIAPVINPHGIRL